MIKLNLFTSTPGAVKPGEKYTLKPIDNNDPFEQKIYDPVTVLEVKAGWVRFDMGFMFKDERLSEKSFLSCYRLVK